MHSASKVMLSVALALQVTGASPADALYITELLALNNSTLADEDGTYSDWLELHNEGGSAVNLAGYYLTDDDELLTKWQIPSVSIPAGGYLLVWASNKNRTNPALPLHTNFALGGSGEYLALVAPDGVSIVHEYAPQFPPQTTDRSYGLASDLLTERCFLDPTPGAANDETTGCDLVAEVEFSVTRGFYDAPFNVALSTATAGATIHYTVDGSDPTPGNGLTYASPIPVSTPSTTTGACSGPSTRSVTPAPAASAPPASAAAPSSARVTVVPTATTRPPAARTSRTARAVASGISKCSGRGRRASSAGSPVDDSPAACETRARRTPRRARSSRSPHASGRPAEGISAQIGRDA